MISSSPETELPPHPPDTPDSPLPIPDTPQSSNAPSQSSTRPASPLDDPADKIASQQELADSDHQAPGENIPRASSPSVHSIYSSRNRQHETPAGAPLTEAEAARRPDLLKVHWKSRLRDHHVVNMEHASRSDDAEDEKSEKRQARQMASRLVRKHTGRPPPTAISDSETDSDHTNIPSSSAVSLHSYDSAGSPPKRRRRQSSGRSSMSSGWASTDDISTDDDTHVSGGGVLSALLGLYRSEERDKEKGTLRGLLRGRDGEDGHRGRTRRRWSSQSLFATASASSSIAGSRRGSRDLDEGLAADELQERLQHESTRVHRNRRHQSLPHRSQDLNQPYIPSPKYSNALTPSPNITIAQKLKRFMSAHASGATWFGYPTARQGFEDPGPEGNQRALAALLITTNSLVAAASPTLAHVAPAAGVDAETSDGRRKVSWYEGIGERQARDEDQERREDEVLGSTRETDLEKGLDQGKYKKQGGKHRRRRGKRVQKELAVTKHVTNIIQRKKFIEMLAKAVVRYGAPAHSVEAWLSATADILQVEASFIFFPSILIVAFRDSDVHSTDVLFIRPSGGLELYRLSLVHEVYRRVVHDEISASQGCRVLRRIEKRTTPYSRFCLILAAAVASATSARVAFSGSFIDILMSGALGSLLAIVQFTIAERNKLVANIFEIGMAGILSFASRGLGATKYFCYQSLASAAIVLILPGWHVCMGALELGSKNIVAGAIRLVWAVVYTLFLSLGLGIGSEIWDAFGPSQPSETSSSTPSMATIEGSFTSNNTYWDQTFNNGTFTFTNGSSTTEQATNVACYRNPDWTYWWYTEPSDWWLFLLVPLFAFSLAVWFRADYRSRDMIVMVLVACAGYVVNFFLTDQIDQSNVVSAVSAFTLGILGNLYSRLGGGSAFPSMVVGILLLVPNAIAAAGGLSASSSSSQNDASNVSGGSSSSEINAAVVVSIRMVQVGIGLAIGLFAAAAVIYPFGKKRRYIFSY